MAWIALIAGLALWTGAHLWKRLAPASRERFGDAGKGIVAGLSLLAIVLMVLGYRGAEGPVWWGRSTALTGINNLLMVVAFLLFGAGSVGSWLSKRMRHPMLTGVKIWAAAHLLVNGDLASFILFGGLLAWAVAQVILINRSESWAPDPDARPGQRDLILVVVWLIIFAAVAWVHTWLGYSPFG